MLDSKEFYGLLGTAIGALASLGGVLITQIFQNKQSKQLKAKEQRALICSKCERIYQLAQNLYEGHLKEIEKLETVSKQVINSTAWQKQRKHPGETMSEIKMLVRMYVTESEAELKQVDAFHQTFKSKFAVIDAAIVNQSTTSDFLIEQAISMRNQLRDFGDVVTNLKLKVAKLVGDSYGSDNRKTDT